MSTLLPLSPPTPDTEPMGIVISRGSRGEPAPHFVAYVYAPDPEPGVDEPIGAAA